MLHRESDHFAKNQFVVRAGKGNKVLVRCFYEDAVNTDNVNLVETLVSLEYAEVHDGIIVGPDQERDLKE